MSLEDFGVQSWASLREIDRDNSGEVVCPVSDVPITYSRGEIDVPVARLADDHLREAFQEADVEYVRSRGYESPSEPLLFPEQVGGPSANGYSSQIVGVRAELTDGAIWIPVHREDLEAADQAHDPTASADGGNAASTTAGPAGVPDAHSTNERTETSVGTVERPQQVAELGLPTEYEDGHPRYTYVGHIQEDEIDVYAGRSSDGDAHLISVDHPGQPGWLGNPYPGREFGREESVAMFTRSLFLALEERPELMEAVYNLRGKVLGCHCHRLEDTGQNHPTCHADVLAKVADRVIKRRSEAGESGGHE